MSITAHGTARVGRGPAMTQSEALLVVAALVSRAGGASVAEVAEATGRSHRWVRTTLAAWSAEGLVERPAGVGGLDRIAGASQVTPVSGVVVHIGPRSAAQVGYELAWETRLGRADDWRRQAGVTPRLAEALAAERRGPRLGRLRRGGGGLTVNGAVDEDEATAMPGGRPPAGVGRGLRWRLWCWARLAGVGVGGVLAAAAGLLLWGRAWAARPLPVLDALVYTAAVTGLAVHAWDAAEWLLAGRRRPGPEGEAPAGGAGPVLDEGHERLAPASLEAGFAELVEARRYLADAGYLDGTPGSGQRLVDGVRLVVDERCRLANMLLPGVDRSAADDGQLTLPPATPTPGVPATTTGPGREVRDV